MYRLWNQGTSLDPQRPIPAAPTVRWPALAVVFSGPGLGDAFYVLEGTDEPGDAFVQTRRRVGRPEADLVYIAPALQHDPAASEMWAHLLTGTCVALGQQGIERVYAGLPESGSESEVEVLREAGFVLYAQEELFRLDSTGGSRPQGGGLQIVPRASEHEWGLTRLYNELVPWLVQQAESGPAFNGSKSGFPRQEAGGDYVLLDGDEVVGLVQISPGSTNYWLNIVLHPRAYHWAEEAIAFGVGRLRGLPQRAGYCAVRHYQGGLRTHLELSGFERVGSRALLVKYTLARVMEAKPRRVEGMDKQTEAAVPTTLACRIPEQGGHQ